MRSFIRHKEKPPEPQAVTDGVVTRVEHVYEVDPRLMEVFPQQDMPLWDTVRIITGRRDYLDWMHDHFADSIISLGGPDPVKPRKAKGSKR